MSPSNTISSLPWDVKGRGDARLLSSSTSAGASFGCSSGPKELRCGSRCVRGPLLPPDFSLSAAKGTAQPAGEQLVPCARLQLRKPKGEPWENLGGFNPKMQLRRRLFPHPPCLPAGGLSTTGTKESHPWDTRSHPGRRGSCLCCRAAAGTLPCPPACAQGFCRWVSSVLRACWEQNAFPRHACAQHKSAAWGPSQSRFPPGPKTLILCLLLCESLVRSSVKGKGSSQLSDIHQLFPLLPPFFLFPQALGCSVGTRAQRFLGAFAEELHIRRPP